MITCSLSLLNLFFCFVLNVAAKTLSTLVDSDRTRLFGRPKQCDQIGLVLNILGNNFTYKK